MTNSINNQKEVQEKLDASLMYGVLFTWLVLQIVVLPVVSGGGCMSRMCPQKQHAGKLGNKSSKIDNRMKSISFERQLR